MLPPAALSLSLSLSPSLSLSIPVPSRIDGRSVKWVDAEVKGVMDQIASLRIPLPRDPAISVTPQKKTPRNSQKRTTAPTYRPFRSGAAMLVTETAAIFAIMLFAAMRASAFSAIGSSSSSRGIPSSMMTRSSSQHSSHSRVRTTTATTTARMMRLTARPWSSVGLVASSSLVGRSSMMPSRALLQVCCHHRRRSTARYSNADGDDDDDPDDDWYRDDDDAGERDYESLKIIELRELLRERGLSASGIRANLIERLRAGNVDPSRVGNRPRTSTSTGKSTNNTKKTTTNGTTNGKERWENVPGGRRERRMAIGRARSEMEGGGGDGNDDDAFVDGAVESTRTMGRTISPSSSSSSSSSWTSIDDVRTTITEPTSNGDDREMTSRDDPIRGVIVDLNRRSGGNNIIFANDGEEESEDEWDSDDDDIDDIDIDDGFDPNETVESPLSGGDVRPSGGEGSTMAGATKGASSFVEDFRGTRVFVQGLPEEATWKDVSRVRRCICLSTPSSSLDRCYSSFRFYRRPSA